MYKKDISYAKCIKYELWKYDIIQNENMKNDISFRIFGVFVQ